MNSNVSLSCVVWSETGDKLYSFEQAADFTQTSVSLLERFASLGLIEPVGAMLRRQDLIRVVQIQRLHRDLNLNWIGAAMLLDMAAEIAQLKAQLRAYRASHFHRSS
ncbi:MAG: chaperone modulator CbpM [Microcystaceae cyanobacterium]